MKRNGLLGLNLITALLPFIIISLIALLAPILRIDANEYKIQILIAYLIVFVLWIIIASYTYRKITLNNGNKEKIFIVMFFMSFSLPFLQLFKYYIFFDNMNINTIMGWTVLLMGVVYFLSIIIFEIINKTAKIKKLKVLYKKQGR